MAISECISLSAENKIEKKFSDAAALHVNETGYHGTLGFPVAIYLDDVSHKYVNWHWHEEFEIGFITEGSVILGCGNRKYQMECGDIFFINSNVLHSMHRNTASKQAIFKSIAFHSSIISENINSVFYIKYLFPILSNGNFRECIITKESNSYENMFHKLSKVWNLIYSEAPDYEIKVRNELSTLFCILNQLQKNIKETISPKKQNYQLEKRVQVLLDYIQLAKTASIIKTEVLRCFKTIMGSSPINYLNRYRLQRAAHMLIHTEKNIQEVAGECGFDDNSYFSKLFKKKYHVTPHEYRRPK